MLTFNPINTVILLKELILSGEDLEGLALRRQSSILEPKQALILLTVSNPLFSSLLGVADLEEITIQLNYFLTTFSFFLLYYSILEASKTSCGIRPQVRKEQDLA